MNASFSVNMTFNLYGPLHRVLQDTQSRVYHGPEAGRSSRFNLGAIPPWNRYTLPPGIAGCGQRLPVLLDVAVY